MTHRYLGSCLLLLGAFGCARHNFYQPDARLTPTEPIPADKTVRVTAGRHYQHGALHNLFLGKHYRDVWAQPVQLPVLQPRTVVPGGLDFEKLGGGFQTLSMTLEDGQGREYALRSIDKTPARTLPKVLRHTFVMNLVRDATSAAMPYGALVVPPLAEAAGVLHTNPQMFYVSGQEQRLGPSSELFQGKLVLLEEKFDGQENLTPAFGKATGLVDSDDMLHLRYLNPTHRIDQVAFARARLLDIWLGDWDRHEGQWQWAVYQQDDQTRYKPIPKDRDQVFFRFDDGVIPWLMSRKWAVRKFRTFKPKYEDIAGMVRNARFIDARGLNEVTKTQFHTLALDLQRRLTDAAIAEAVHRLPPPIYALEGPGMEEALRTRRAALPAVADAFYDLLAECVTITGTDEAERFVVDRLTDTTTRVTVYSLLGKNRPAPYYQRTFRAGETERITLYGLGGKDEFNVQGQVGRGIRIDVYGGPGADAVVDSSHVARGGNRLYYYDTKHGNELTEGPNTADHREKGVKMHAYDREGY